MRVSKKYDLTFNNEIGVGSNHFHHPSEFSGVTIGPGYDFKHRKPKDVLRHFEIIIGDLEPLDSAILKMACGLSGEEAREFCEEYKDRIDLSVKEQRALFELITPSYEAKAIKDYVNMFEDYDHVPSYHTLPSEIKDLIFDFTYNLGSINKFPRFFKALLTGDRQAAFANYKRYTGGKPLGRRNDDTLKVLENVMFAKLVY